MKREGLVAPGTVVVDADPHGSILKTRRVQGVAPDVALAETMRSPMEPIQSGVRGRALAGMDLAPGTRIEGDYRVVGPIGSGAMGLVVCAHDERLDRRVAIKFVRPALLSVGFRERFASEARAMARVNHPNVLHIYASGEHGGVPFFVMELVEGNTLEKWLDDRSRGAEQVRSDLDVGMRILEETCLGVSAIHEAGTLHRDIKPSNILLDLQQHPRIADLGLAVLNCDHEEAAAEIVGTPAYMAPEAAMPRALDPELRPRADVYSLGCVAYELLTAQRPFHARTGAELLAMHASAPVRPPSDIHPELVRFDECVARALAKDPVNRTATVDAFRRELVLAREGESQPVRILVAEDDPDFRELLRMAFAREFPDAHVECVADGREALAAFDRKAPSVAILDLQMPALSGLELTALIRSRESSQTVPIVVLTGEGGPEEWRRLSALGADRFFVKPVVIDDVVAAVRRALRERTSPRSRA